LKRILLFVLTLSCSVLQTQELAEVPKQTYFVAADISLGYTVPFGDGFPKTYLGQSYAVQFGRHHYRNQDEWAYRLRYPRTGLSFSFTDFQNSKNVGYSISVIPYIEVHPFGLKRISFQAGMGISYFNGQYEYPFDMETDVISTHLNWAVSLFGRYQVLHHKQWDLNVGLGYLHFSNGHSRIPNTGLNTLLVSTRMQYNFAIGDQNYVKEKVFRPAFKKSRQRYFEIRPLFGRHALSEEFNRHKNVYGLSVGYGTIYNNTFKLGFGAYYQFYSHFYNYIKDNEQLVEESYQYFREQPFLYASNFGVMVHGELLLNHIGIECDIGYNIYKPFYEIEKQIGQTFTFVEDTPNGPETTYLYGGKLNGGYRLKKSIYSRLGLRYYLKGTKEQPKYNFFIGANIKTNAGQADFSEFSAGMTYALPVSGD